MPFFEAYSLAFTIAAAAVFVNAIDDLAPTFICAVHMLRHVFRPGDGLSGELRETLRRQDPMATATNHAERHIAIFVPCWKEAAVIGDMVRHNLAAIRYSKFDFFLGVYPNDAETLKVVNGLAAVYRNVHVALVPHDGPTSKADCLNWTYQSLCDFEENRGIRVDTVVIHDAEDLIHPDALRVIHAKRFEYDMVQVPVLALRTGITELTHGIYCDEFAEYQAIDMRARILSRSFLPSNGVGTGYSRAVLDRLAEVRSNRVFEPVALTEDYECGVRIHQLGFKQTFARMWPDGGGNDLGCPIATREYFPRSFRSAIRQRTRWVTGISLQGWERIGWNGSRIDRYWFWRDRKALFVNPLGMAVSTLALLAAADFAVSGFLHQPWHFALTAPLSLRLCQLNISIQIVRLLIRMVCAGRIYGIGFAFGVPVRAFYQSFVNGCATLNAWKTYLGARLGGRPLVWLKTDHTYPNRATLSSSWKTIEEVLMGSDYLSADALSLAQQTLPAGTDLGMHLVENGWISEEALREALSLATGMDAPCLRIDPKDVSGRVGRLLPLRIQRSLKVLPVGVRSGGLVLATVLPPPEETHAQLARYTHLRLEFQLVTPGNFESLRCHLHQWRARVVEPRSLSQTNKLTSLDKAIGAAAR